MTTNKSGIYIHIPFCIKKCNYCAFLSGPSDEASREEYVDLLCREIRLRAGESGKNDTIFFGGGTPSLLTPAQIDRILREVRRCHDVSDDVEITLEANPATLTPESLAAYREAGVNRLSMGVQSMNDATLKRLGRIHTAEQVRKDFRAAREAGFDNINLDLIFAVPGTTLDESQEDLDQVIDLGPEHISFYSLQLEQGTPFFDAFEAGQLHEIPDDLDREMYHAGIYDLRMNGYEHYEFSNFAKTGRRSRHNQKYWNMSQYLGLGLGASSFTGGNRIVNVSSMNEYRDMLRERELPFDDVHENSEHDNISEAVFTGMRRREGIFYEDILGSREAFFEYYKNEREQIMEFVREGYLLLSDVNMTLSEKGIDISNKIMALFV